MSLRLYRLSLVICSKFCMDFEARSLVMVRPLGTVLTSEVAGAEGGCVFSFECCDLDHSLNPESFFKLCCLSFLSFDLNLSFEPEVVLEVEFEAVLEASEDREGFSRDSYCCICSHLASTDSSLWTFCSSMRL